MKKEEGFSLAEVIIASSVAVVVGALLLSIMVNSSGIFYQQSAKVNQGVGLNDSQAKLRGAVKEAKAIAATYTSGTTTYTSSGTQLVLQLPAIDSSGNQIFNVFDYEVFLITSGRFYFKVFPNTTGGSARKSADQILTSGIDSVKFDYFDKTGALVTPTAATKVRTTLTLKQKAGVGYQVSIATSEANLRND